MFEWHYFWVYIMYWFFNISPRFWLQNCSSRLMPAYHFEMGKVNAKNSTVIWTQLFGSSFHVEILEATSNDETKTVETLTKEIVRYRWMLQNLNESKFTHKNNTNLYMHMGYCRNQMHVPMIDVFWGRFINISFGLYLVDLDIKIWHLTKQFIITIHRYYYLKITCDIVHLNISISGYF